MPRPRNSNWASNGGAGLRPLAVTLPEAAEVLGVPECTILELATGVEPYIAHDGSLRWSLKELRAALAAPVGVRVGR